MKNWIILLLIAASSTLAQFQIDLHGRLVDKSGNSVYGAVVYLEKYGLRDTTDQTGKFHLYGKSSSISHTIGKAHYNLHNIPSRSVISIHDTRGVVVYSGVVDRVPEFYFNGNYILNIRNKSNRAVFYGSRLVKGQLNSVGSALFKTSVEDTLQDTTVSDTLVLERDGQVIQEVAVSDFLDTLPDMYIVQRDIYGRFTASLDSGYSIHAEVFSPNGYKRFKLGHNKLAQSFSGFLYMPYLPNDTNIYKIVVTVANSKYHTSQTDTVEFDKFIGDINIPDLDPYNNMYWRKNVNAFALGRIDSNRFVFFSNRVYPEMIVYTFDDDILEYITGTPNIIVGEDTFSPTTLWAGFGNPMIYSATGNGQIRSVLVTIDKNLNFVPVSPILELNEYEFYHDSLILAQSKSDGMYTSRIHSIVDSNYRFVYASKSEGELGNRKNWTELHRISDKDTLTIFKNDHYHVRDFMLQDSSNVYIAFHRREGFSENMKMVFEFFKVNKDSNDIDSTKYTDRYEARWEDQRTAYNAFTDSDTSAIFVFTQRETISAIRFVVEDGKLERKWERKYRLGDDKTFQIEVNQMVFFEDKITVVCKHKVATSGKSPDNHTALFFIDYDGELVPWK